ncbi:serine:threonine protein kinase TAO1 [Echinococcus multilocularis]|uniref:non-specific serine/threonine protein kinase n=1 Tax=Echinococcus multilocularis TaxID=6211 RepID=A0A068YEK2_ECHMU|nr:serine:threonine protein kinase TAO1 [Echinococcus multilocularis]
MVGTGEVVAIKKLKYDTKRKVSLEDLKDMRREVEFIKRINHKNCVQCRGCYIDQQVPWIVMEYCLGSVADILKVQRHPLKECEISCIVREVLTGLVYIHSRNYIHRDIKAANILFTESGGVKVGDFGSVSFKSPANSFVGTPYWIAPEVILAMENGLYDCRVDVWSLGITCVEMAELKPPYMECANTMAALYQIALNPAPTLREANWTSDFYEFVDFVLKKNPEERPTSAKALNHRFCTSIRNPTQILHDLVQRGMANATEGNQVRSKSKKVHENSTDSGGGGDAAVDSPARNGAVHRRLQQRDSYDRESQSTADGATESTSNSLRSGLSGCSSTSLPVPLPQASKTSSAASETHYECLGEGLPSEGGRVRDGSKVRESTTATGGAKTDIAEIEDSVSASHPNPPQFVLGEPVRRGGVGGGGDRGGATEDSQGDRGPMGAAISADTRMNGADSGYANIHPSITTGGGGGAILSAPQPLLEQFANQAQAHPLPDPPAFLHHLSTTPSPTQPIFGDHRREPIRPTVRSNASRQQSQQQQQNFPTLKTQRMMRAAPSAAIMLGECGGASGGTGGGGGSSSQSDVNAAAADGDVCLDAIYSFGALKRLCARHMKKLEQEKHRLNEIEHAKMAELNREYSNFIGAKKKSLCRMQAQHVSEVDRLLKRDAEEEARYVRHLEMRGKEQLKNERKSRLRPNNMAVGGGNSPYNDMHAVQLELDLLYKQIQSSNNFKLYQWKYQKLRSRYKLQVEQFKDRKDLETRMLDEKFELVLRQQDQVEAMEMANLHAKHQLQSRHLEEKCAFFDTEQKRFEDLKMAEFEKEARNQRKMLAKEVKQYEEGLRPQKKGAGWLLNRRKATAVSSPQLQESSSPEDKSKAAAAPPNNPPLLTVGKSKLSLEEFRRKRTEELEERLAHECSKLNERMRQLREQMHSYQDRLARDFRAQCDQEKAELSGRIKARAEQLEEAIESNKKVVLEGHNQEERKLDSYFADLQRNLENDCQFLGVDFQAVRLSVEAGVRLSSPLFRTLFNPPSLCTWILFVDLILLLFTTTSRLIPLSAQITSTTANATGVTVVPTIISPFLTPFCLSVCQLRELTMMPVPPCFGDRTRVPQHSKLYKIALLFFIPVSMY